jgi:hypothetical protein
MMMRFVFRVLLSMINIQGIRIKFESEVICLYRIQDVEDDDMDEAPGVKTPALVVGKKYAKPAEEESDDEAAAIANKCLVLSCHCPYILHLGLSLPNMSCIFKPSTDLHKHPSRCGAAVGVRQDRDKKI